MLSLPKAKCECNTLHLQFLAMTVYTRMLSLYSPGLYLSSLVGQILNCQRQSLVQCWNKTPGPEIIMKWYIILFSPVRIEGIILLLLGMYVLGGASVHIKATGSITITHQSSKTSSEGMCMRPGRTLTLSGFK